jgi:hypothetical protein
VRLPRRLAVEIPTLENPRAEHRLRFDWSWVDGCVVFFPHRSVRLRQLRLYRKPSTDSGGGVAQVLARSYAPTQWLAGIERGEHRLVDCFDGVTILLHCELEVQGVSNLSRHDQHQQTRNQRDAGESRSTVEGRVCSLRGTGLQLVSSRDFRECAMN